MKPFTVCEGPAAALPIDNLDTDVIVRIERIAQLPRGQLGPWAFEPLRYTGDGRENPAFVLNRPPFRGAPILLAGANFGCGSSREMAVWALEEAGIRCVIAPSFGDIFRSNCLQNGLLPVVLERSMVERLSQASADGSPLRVDLRRGSIESPRAGTVPFHLPPAESEDLLFGRDDIDRSLQLTAQAETFRARDRALRPWAYFARP